jgi:hypothetical protein
MGFSLLVPFLERKKARERRRGRGGWMVEVVQIKRVEGMLNAGEGRAWHGGGGQLLERIMPSA